MKNNNIISIIIPTYKGEKSIKLLCDEIIKKFNFTNFEIVIVDDNSPDNTKQICLDMIDQYHDDILYIKLTKNFGEHNAVFAGLKYCKGDWAIIIDDDFQNPISEAVKLTNYALQNSYDIIYSNYKSKKHSIFRNFASKLNDISASIFLKKPKNLYLSSFKIIKKNIIEKILQYNGPSPYIDGLILSVTSNISYIDTEHHERDVKFGKSSYNIVKLLKLYIDVISSFSTRPLRICSIIGLITTIIAVIFGIIIIFEKIYHPNLPSGYPSLIVAIIFFSGIQLIFLGLIGEYIGKILKNVNNNKPYYIELIKKNNNKN
jgi:glycosyltransferase involved in cell wall biosynthesis